MRRSFLLPLKLPDENSKRLFPDIRRFRMPDSIIFVQRCFFFDLKMPRFNAKLMPWLRLPVRPSPGMTKKRTIQAVTQFVRPSIPFYHLIKKCMRPIFGRMGRNSTGKSPYDWISNPEWNQQKKGPFRPDTGRNGP